MLKDLNIVEKQYFEPEDLIGNVINPCLKESTNSSLLSAFFNFESFLEISDGLEHFLKNDGTMRILISIPKHFEHYDHEKLDKSIIEAYSNRGPEETYSNFKKTILSKSGKLKEELKKNKVALIAYLVKQEIVKIKFSIRETGYDHSKIYIFNDNKDTVVLSGAMNWTFMGLNDQSNQTIIQTSYGSSVIWEDSVQRFEDVWNNKAAKLTSFEFDADLADELLDKVNIPEYSDVEKFFESKQMKSLYYDLKTSPLYFEYNLGNSALLPHQIYGINKGLESWPIRHLYADEVGLGKTLEVGATIAYLSIFHQLNRIVILAPQSVVNQWQTEMKIHFGLDFYTLSSNKKYWTNSSGEEFPRTEETLNYNIDYPKYVIMSKDLARGSLNNHIFSDSDLKPDLLVVDEAHHARGSRKTKTFKQTLLRRLVSDVKEEINHIIFATATPMRTHPDEYYFLLELLGIEKYLSETDFKIFLENLSLDIDDWGLEEIIPTANLIRSVNKNTQFLNQTTFNSDEIKLLNNLDSKIQDISFLNENKKTIYELALKFNPLALFTSRSSRDVLVRYPETYKFPKRNFETSPITAENISLDFSKFFEQIMSYTDSSYLLSEKSMGVQMQNNAFAKAGFKESFVSSFWSARERLRNRSRKIEEYIDAFENNNYKEVLEDKNLLEELELGEELEPLEEIQKISDSLNIGSVLNSCKMEKAEVDELLDLAEYIISNNKQPDPKIKELIKILEKLTLEEKPTLIFAHYIATLDSAYEEIITKFSDKISGIGMFKGSDIWYEIDGHRYSTDKYGIKKLLESGEISILLCSEAASEGINLQSADKLINLDVPWVPSMLEQRIGRIARLGQESEEVRIYNLWYPDSYEAKIYTALIKRVDLLSLAMGHFPQIVSQKIKSEVKDADNEVSALINELNEKKAEDEFIGLSQLWNYDKENHETFGNTFRKDLINLLSQFDIETSDLTHEAGEMNVITLRNRKFKDFITKAIVRDKGDYELSKLLCGEKLYGFLINRVGGQSYYLLNPRKLNLILESLFSSKKNKIETIKEFNDIQDLNLEDIVSVYKNTLQDWFLPSHSTFIKYFDKRYSTNSPLHLEKVSRIEIEI